MCSSTVWQLEIHTHSRTDEAPGSPFFSFSLSLSFIFSLPLSFSQNFLERDSCGLLIRE